MTLGSWGYCCPWALQAICLKQKIQSLDQCPEMRQPGAIIVVKAELKKTWQCAPGGCFWPGCFMFSHSFFLWIQTRPEERQPEAGKVDGQSGVIQTGWRKQWGSAKINADALQDLFPWSKFWSVQTGKIVIVQLLLTKLTNAGKRGNQQPAPASSNNSIMPPLIFSNCFMSLENWGWCDSCKYNIFFFSLVFLP